MEKEFAHFGHFIGSVLNKKTLSAHTYLGGINLASERGMPCCIDLIESNVTDKLLTSSHLWFFPSAYFGSTK